MLHVVGELVGEALGRALITVRGDDHRPAGLLDVEPRLHGEERRRGRDRPLPALGPGRNHSFIGPCAVKYCSWCVIMGILRHATVGLMSPERCRRARRVRS